MSLRGETDTLVSGGSKNFPGGAPTPKGRVNLLFGIVFAENGMKMKRIGLNGSSRPSPPDPPLLLYFPFCLENLLWIPINLSAHPSYERSQVHQSTRVRTESTRPVRDPEFDRAQGSIQRAPVL